MKQIYKNRLLKLAKHLRSGKLGHKKFDFTVINADENGNELDENGCGALGCAMGELPVAFPKVFRFVKGLPVPVSLAERARVKELPFPVYAMAQRYFDIGWHEANHLFSPSLQMTQTYGGRMLSGTATAKQVAANIEAFVKRKEREKA